MAAGKFGSASFFGFLDGISIAAWKVKNFAYKVMSETEDTTGLGDSWREHTPTGVGSLTITQGEALFDTTATTGAHTVLSAAPPTSPQAASKVLCVGFGSDAAGEPFVGAAGAFVSSYEAAGVVGGIQKANATFTMTGRFEPGQIVQPLATKTGDWNGDTDNTEVDFALFSGQRVIPITSATKANPCVVTTTVPHGLTTGQKVLISGNTLSGPAINSDLAVTVVSTTTFSVAVDTSGSSGAGTGGSFVLTSTVNGAVGFLHVTACSGFSNFVGKIRDSADNSTYADLVTFADNVTDPFAERATVTGTVDRYLIFDGNVTGTGSITCWSGLARL